MTGGLRYGETVSFFALRYGEALATLEYRGATGSSDHPRAHSNESNFEYTRVAENFEIISGMDGILFGEQLRMVPVKGCFSKAPLVGLNEADVQTVVHDTRQDAVNICNIMLGLDNNKEGNTVLVCREGNLFTNQPDHSRPICKQILHLCTHKQSVPVVKVQEKPGDAAVDDNRVHGQPFDQLLNTVLSKHKGNAIGVITSIKKTRVAWIGDEADRIVEEGSFLSLEKLRECRKRLSTRDGVPLSRKTEEYAQQQNGGIQMQVSATPHRNAKKARIEVKRELFLSCPFQANDLLHVFCNLIIAGILLHDPDTVGLSRSDTPVDIPASVVLHSGGKAPMLETLAAVVRGPATKPRFSGLARKVASSMGMVPSPKYFLGKPLLLFDLERLFEW